MYGYNFCFEKIICTGNSLLLTARHICWKGQWLYNKWLTRKKKTHFGYRFTRNRLLSIFSRYIVQLTITICIICQLKSQGSLGRGTQRRFPSKYVENTFQAIQSSFRSQEKHSRRRYKIGSCSVTLGDFASFTCRNYKGFRIIFPKILDAIYPCKKMEIFLIPLSITFLNPKGLGLVFLRKTAEKQHY